jgi:hypothetical protein
MSVVPLSTAALQVAAEHVLLLDAVRRMFKLITNISTARRTGLQQGVIRPVPCCSGFAFETRHRRGKHVSTSGPQWRMIPTSQQIVCLLLLLFASTALELLVRSHVDNGDCTASRSLLLCCCEKVNAALCIQLGLNLIPEQPQNRTEQVDKQAVTRHRKLSLHTGTVCLS